MLLLKHTLDIWVSGLALLVLAVPVAVIAGAIKLDSKGPVLFRQERIGKDGKPFRIFKFRSMADGSEHTGLGTTTSPEDSRITRIGRVLRQFSLDEIPQLVNVLTGEMSLVGPRPTLSYQVEQYSANERRRLDMKPGVTSLPSVRGRNALSWRKRIDLDVWYVEHWSLWLDLKILCRTLWVALITREGIYGSNGVNDDFVT